MSLFAFYIECTGVGAFAKADQEVGNGLGGYVERIACAGCYCKCAGDACLGDVGYMRVLLGETMDGVGNLARHGIEGGGTRCRSIGDRVGANSYGIVFVKVGEAGIESYCDGCILGSTKVDGDGFGAANTDGEWF